MSELLLPKRAQGGQVSGSERPEELALQSELKRRVNMMLKEG